jgi:hypothetical protein
MPVFKIKKLNDNERQQYKDEVAKIIEDRDKRFDKLFEVYGPNGKLPQGYSLKNEFDSIEVPLPVVEGMSPEDSKKLATAIILGSIMNPEKMAVATSADASDEDKVYFNQYYLVENIIKGDPKREGNYPPIMVQAKQAAADAIKDLNNGDPTAAKKMLDDFIEYGAKFTATTGIYRSDIEHTSEKVYFPATSAARLAFDQIGKKPVNANGPSDNPVTDIQKKVGQKTLEAVDRVFDIKNRLLTEPSGAGSAERKELVEKLLFDEYLINLSFVEADNRTYETGEYVAAIAEKIGYGTDHELYDEMDPVRRQLDNDVKTVLKYNTVTDLQVILSKDDGYERLKTLYMDSIRNSDLYQKMVAADGDAIIDVMKIADKHISTKSFYDFDEAVTRLNEGNYENRNALLKDAALAMTGKLYNLNGKLPNNPKTKKPYTFTEYAKALAKEPSFTATINKGNGLNDAAKLFARVAGDATKLKAMLAKTNMVGQNLQAQNKNVNKNANKNANIEQGKRK